MLYIRRRERAVSIERYQPPRGSRFYSLEAKFCRDSELSEQRVGHIVDSRTIANVISASVGLLPHVRYCSFATRDLSRVAIKGDLPTSTDPPSIARLKNLPRRTVNRRVNAPFTAFSGSVHNMDKQPDADRASLPVAPIASRTGAQPCHFLPRLLASVSEKRMGVNLTGPQRLGDLGTALASYMALIADSDAHVIDGALDVIASFGRGMRCIVLTSPGLREGGRSAFERTLFFAGSPASHLDRFE